MAERPLAVALRPLWLGDLLTGIPALRALRDALPEHRLVLAAPSVLAPLARASGAVDDVAPTEPLAPLDPSLRRAEVAVDLHGKGPASQRVLLAARPARLVAFRNAEVPETAGMPEWRDDEHEVARWCRLLAESGVPADPSRLDLDPNRVPVRPALVGATVLHPGAKAAARRWPAERYAAVARAEARAGRRVVVTGSAAERPLAEEVAARGGLPDEAVLAGRTSLVELAGVVAAAGRVVCGDTGTAHLATAFGTPSVVLFGPTPPALWGPPPERPQHVPLWAGKRGDPHGDAPHDGLLDLGVDDVLAALDRLETRERAA